MSSTSSCAKDEGSCGGGESPPREAPVPPRWAAYNRRSRRWKAWATTPGLLLALGIALLAVGAALVATPLTIARTRRGGGSAASRPNAQPQPQPASVNAEGVPIDAMLADQQQQDELVDCRSQLQDPSVYFATSAAAEASLLGAGAAALPRPELQRVVGGLPPLLFGTVFWVLVSESHPWAAPEFQAAAGTQVDVLNAAFEGLNWRFRLDGVVQVPAAALVNITGGRGDSAVRRSGDEWEGSWDDEGSSDGSDSSSSSGGTGIGDVVVEQCLRRWARLEQVLLPPGTSSRSEGGGSSGSGGGQSDPPAIHVIVCEPEGVNGAALVLGDAAAGQLGGDEGSDEGAPSGGTVLLRRGALWQSRTSLVHQLGHFFGLPHPFLDDKRTCKVDGDGVADTPQQYAANTGCQKEGDDQHVCPAAEDGPVAASELPVPIVNYMDLTNDTCRRHFTIGQAARMQAMLRWQRPRLFAAALAVPMPQQALAWQAAWQSGLPPAVVQQQQREAVLQQALLALNSSRSGSASASRGSTSTDSLGRLVESAATAAVRYADGWAQAGLAADGQLSTAVQDCACLGPDGARQLFWTGQLNGSYPVAAVRLLLPIQADSSSGSSQDDGAADNAAGAKGGGADNDAGPDEAATDSLAPAEVAAAPAPAILPASKSTAAAAAAAAGQAAALRLWLEVEVWIGDSLDHSQNQRCTAQQSLQSGQPLQQVQCDVPLPVGRYVTVAVVAAAAQQQQAQVCLCEVQALPAVGPDALAAPPASSSSGSDAVDYGAPSSLPAAPLNLTAAVASQSSEANAGQGGAASAALASWPPQLGRQQCSSTGGELAPWWSLDAGLDGVWVRGLRLSLPLPCVHEAVLGPHNSSAHASQDCVPPLPANLTVHVGDAPPAQLLARTTGRRDGSSVCAAGVAVLAGRPTVIDCGRHLHGRYVTVTATAPLGTVLSLCDVQLLGGEELPLSQHMLPHRKALRRKGSGAAAGGASDGSGALRVAPSSLLPSATLPIDGVAGSCLLAPANSSTSWQLQLDGSYSVLAVRLAATQAAAGPAGKSSSAGGRAASTGTLSVGLLDAGGAEVASWRTAGSSSTSDASGSSSLDAVLLELPAATHAAAVKVEGFASLCDVQLLAASNRKVAAYQLVPLANLSSSSNSNSSSSSSSDGSSLPSGELPQAAGEWRVLDGVNGSALSAGLAAALLDGNPTTCAVLRPAEAVGGPGPLRPVAVELQLDRPVRLSAVRLLAAARRNITVKAAAPRRQAAPRLDWSVAWPGAATCQEQLELPSWQPVYAACQPPEGQPASQGSGPLLTDRLLLQLAAPGSPAANATADELTLQLCEISLFGLPAAAGA